MRKKTAFWLIAAAMCALLSGCYDAVDLNQNVYLLAIGIDKGVGEKYRFCMQLARPVSESDGNNGDEKAKDCELVEVEAPDIVTALYTLRTFKSKRINASHIKVAIFGEEVAKEGILPLLAALLEPDRIHTNVYLAVAKGSAAQFLAEVKPQTELYITKYYERMFHPSHGINLNAPRLYRTYFTLLEERQSIVLPLLALNEADTKIHAQNEWGAGFISGAVPRVGQNKAEMAGSAYFRGDKMAGVMTEEESLAFFMLSGDYTMGYITLTDPQKSNRVLVLRLGQARQPQVKLDLERHQADIRLSFTGEIYYEESKEEKGDKTRYVEERISDFCYQTVTRLTREKVDALGLCRYADSLFWTQQERDQLDWERVFQEMNYKIDTKVTIKRTGRITQ